MPEDKVIRIVMAIGVVFSLIYIFFFRLWIGPPNQHMLKNTKYAVGIVTSGYYTERGRSGNDFKFMYDGGDIIEAKANKELTKGRKYLVAFDSVDIKNGFIILEKYDITDSLIQHKILPKYIMYSDTWSLVDIPFQYDKSEIEYDLKRAYEQE
ncbi:hypothetical protein [Chryseobacterium kwangjuense]|uniref:Uncharacterized protein n=1 Tax=Chryseobacterium kwangjuense TaxID=267125 RepID=A0A135WDX9_9FLAO|nr:hypothetical protein [Chryseobacterium kwangjuense]KXH83081.1 hypothetical protein AU378_11655 [Chryseobacterium kwangjuense]